MSFMRHSLIRQLLSLCLLACLWGGFQSRFTVRASVAADKRQPNAPAAPKKGGLGQYNLSFEQNIGQSDPQARFIARSRGLQVFLTDAGSVYQLAGADVLRVSLKDSHPKPAITAEQRLETVSNYYRGQDHTKWRRGAAHFARVRYAGVYEGVDQLFYGRGNELEYDFIVRAGADAGRIRLSFAGAERVSVDAEGNLSIKTANAELLQQKPFAYQEAAGERREVASRWEVSGDAAQGWEARFALGDYDRSRELRIDPVVRMLSYFGGSSGDDVGNLAVDRAGNLFVTGKTASSNFPQANGLQLQASYVAKIAPDGVTLQYVTFLDGSDVENLANIGFGLVQFFRAKESSIAIDANGNAYVSGTTHSRDFPTTANAYQPNDPGGIIGDQKGYFAKLNAAGAVVYSTYFGGLMSDIISDIAVDSLGRAHIVGRADSGLSFPKKNQFQGCGLSVGGSVLIDGGGHDAFYAVLNPNLSNNASLVYSTCIGGIDLSGDNEAGLGVAVDADNNGYLAGVTHGNGYPTKNAFQAWSPGGDFEGVLTKFNPSLSGQNSVVFSTFIGGIGHDQANAVAVGTDGKIYVAGHTESNNFPLGTTPFDTTNGNNNGSDGFITVFNPDGTLFDSTYWGGTDTDQALEIAVDRGHSVYLAGFSGSPNLPLCTVGCDNLPGNVNNGFFDAFVTKFRFQGPKRGIVSSTFLGGLEKDHAEGLAVGGNNRIYLGGSTSTVNLPVTPGAFQAIFGGGEEDGFIAKLLDTHRDGVGVFRPLNNRFIAQDVLGFTNLISFSLDNSANALPGNRPVSADWNADGIDTIGAFSDGQWRVKNENSANAPLLSFTFGGLGDLPVTGDWDGDGFETPGVFVPLNSEFRLTNAIPQNGQTLPVNLTIKFGETGDLPLAGDWNGDGIDTIGVWHVTPGQPSEFRLTNSRNKVAPIELTAILGVETDLPVVGDWNQDGFETVGVWRPAELRYLLSNANTGNAAVNLNFVAQYAQPGDLPLSGDWNGK